jgi:uncharacterized protein
VELLGYAASLLIGLTLGLLGGGGSILSIPVLVYLFDIEPVRASAYSLFIVGTTSALGAISKHREGLVNIRTGIAFGIPSIITIFLTRKWLVPSIPDAVLQYGEFLMTKRLLLLGLFAVLMILAAIPMIRPGKELLASAVPNRTVPMILQGSGIGLITGLVGAGGGFLIIPGLVFLTGLPFKTAVGTSLLIIALNSLMGFLGDLLNYEMEWPFLLGVTALAILGVVAGNHLSKKYSGTFLRRSFGWFVLITGAFVLMKELM